MTLWGSYRLRNKRFLFVKSQSNPIEGRELEEPMAMNSILTNNLKIKEMEWK